MTITEVKIRRLCQKERLRAIASITIDGELAVHEIKVIQGQERLFVAMPSQRNESGDRAYRDIVHPISSEARKKIEQAVFAAYQDAVNKNLPNKTEEGDAQNR
ncbi:MAG: septation regulator SpoVG [Oscillospiraceae bacterium]|nr:septation regulator SpoVG [Oscillospiraceae bacterium]MCI9668088.1 septation regulator SpoVG [Oscillospiraceae bacterium]